MILFITQEKEDEANSCKWQGLIVGILCGKSLLNQVHFLLFITVSLDFHHFQSIYCHLPIRIVY